MSASELQRLADELSLQARHLTAQRFLIQSLWVILKRSGTLQLDGNPEPLIALAEGTYGSKGLSPDAEVFSIVCEMVGEARRGAEVIPFPKG